MSHRFTELMTGPQTRSARFGLGLFLALALSMVATREHHFSSALHLADTSWAVFLLAGLYLRPRWMLPALLALAVLIDLFAVWQDGLVLSGCFSPAYPGLLLAYGALWGTGRLATRDWMKSTEEQALWMKLLTLVGWTIAGVLIAFTISNITFWAYSGHFMTMPLTEYADRVNEYVMGYLTATLLYTILTIGGVVGWSLVMTPRPPIGNRGRKSA